MADAMTIGHFDVDRLSGTLSFPQSDRIRVAAELIEGILHYMAAGMNPDISVRETARDVTALAALAMTDTPDFAASVNFVEVTYGVRVEEDPDAA